MQTVSHVTYRAPPANRYLTLQSSFGHIFDVFRDICFKFCECNPTTIFSTAAVRAKYPVLMNPVVGGVMLKDPFKAGRVRDIGLAAAAGSPLARLPAESV